MNWFAIFKTGKHTSNSGETKEYTTEDLDRMVSKFESGKVPIVVGHPKTNDPAWGWIKSIRRVGDTLYAEAENVIDEFAEMVNKKMFPNRSIAINPDGSLRHVGFLGAVPPAVKGLGEVSFNGDVDSIEIKAFNEPDIMEKLVENLNELESLKNEAKIKEREAKAKEFSDFIEKCENEGITLPAMRNHITAIYNALNEQDKTEFSEGNSESSITILKEFLSSLPKRIEFNEIAKKEYNDNEKLTPLQIVTNEIRNKLGK
jgi:hypothetical protein